MLDVTCAVICHKPRVLVAKKGLSMTMPGKYEFPGGKIEVGESAEVCIVREIKEELGIVVKPYYRLSTSTYKYEQVTVRLIPFLCDYVSGEMQLLEHALIEWVDPHRLGEYDWSGADIAVWKEVMTLGARIWR